MILSWIKRLFGHTTVSTSQDAPNVTEVAVEGSRTFMYKYLDFPFGTWQYFGVTANNQDEADMEAINKFQTLVTEGYTVMRNFYRDNPKA